MRLPKSFSSHDNNRKQRRETPTKTVIERSALSQYNYPNESLAEGIFSSDAFLIIFLASNPNEKSQLRL